MGRLSIESIHLKTMKVFFRGKSIHDLNRLVDFFLEEYFLSLQNEWVLDVLRDVQDQGKFTAILSSSPDFLVQAIASRLKVDHYLATQYSLDSNGIIQGLSHTVRGEDKAAYIRSLVASGEYLKNEIVAFSDSIHDLPFLEAAGVPVAVNPDRYLCQYSKKNGWKVL